MLTYKDAKNLLAQYAGRGGGNCPTSKIDLFVREVFEYLLYSAAFQDLREFTFTAQQGVFTIPYEIDSIQKVRINDQVGNVQDKWFEFRSSRSSWGDECLTSENALFEQPNFYPTAYNLPSGGAQVATLGVCDEEADAHIIVQGKDISGREIFTNHKGVKISGEYLSIKKGCKIYTQVKFGEITGIVKTPTNGYVQLLWIDTTCAKEGFLSDYSPLEEVPAYRRYKLKATCSGDLTKVQVLARIRLKEKYSDNDRIPFETLLTLRLAGQRVNADYNNDLQTAQAKDASMLSMIERENEHRRVMNGSPIEMMYGLSPGLIRNTIGSRGWRRR